MLSRYPKQERDRKGMALVGLVFLLFGLAMALFGSRFMAAVGLSIGALCVLPALICNEVGFARCQRLLSLLGSLY